MRKLEIADSKIRDVWRGAGSCRAVLRTMAKAQLSAETIMRHYLRRYV